MTIGCPYSKEPCHDPQDCLRNGLLNCAYAQGRFKPEAIEALKVRNEELQAAIVEAQGREHEAEKSHSNKVISLLADMGGALRESQNENASLKQENADLKTVMIAAAEEIHRVWDAHCDDNGYGPANLMNRLERGLPSPYNYTAGAFEEMRGRIAGLESESASLKAQTDRLAADLGYAWSQHRVVAESLASAREAEDGLRTAAAFAGYLADSAESLIKKLEDYYEHVDYPQSEGDSVPEETIQEHSERVSDAMKGLRSRIYEFRKRNDRIEKESP